MDKAKVKAQFSLTSQNEHRVLSLLLQEIRLAPEKVKLIKKLSQEFVMEEFQLGDSVPISWDVSRNSAQKAPKAQYLYLICQGKVRLLSFDAAKKREVPTQLLIEGQTLVEIAPLGEPLVLSAILPNKEAGFLETGMSAQVKFDAYPYQDYGVIPSKIIAISPDAESNDRLGEVYRVEVALERDHITDNQKPIKLKAGQTASVDIIIRRRRILDVLLDPIRKLQQDGIDL